MSDEVCPHPFVQFRMFLTVLIYLKKIKIIMYVVHLSWFCPREQYVLCGPDSALLKTTEALSLIFQGKQNRSLLLLFLFNNIIVNQLHKILVCHSA